MIKERTHIKHICLEECKRNVMKLTVYFSLKNLPNDSKNQTLHPKPIKQICFHVLFFLPDMVLFLELGHVILYFAVYRLTRDFQTLFLMRF